MTRLFSSCKMLALLLATKQFCDNHILNFALYYYYYKLLALLILNEALDYIGASFQGHDRRSRKCVSSASSFSFFVPFKIFPPDLISRFDVTSSILEILIIGQLRAVE